MENEKTYLQNLILNRRIVRNYIDSDKPYPDLSEISKLTIKIPTAGFSRGIEIISVEDKKNIQTLKQNLIKFFFQIKKLIKLLKKQILK